MQVICTFDNKCKHIFQRKVIIVTYNLYNTNEFFTFNTMH